MAEETRRVSSLFVTLPALFFGTFTLFLSLVGRETGLTALSLLIIGIAVSLRVWGCLSMSRLECGRSVGRERMFAGDSLTLVLSAVNRKLLPIWLELSTTVHALSSEGRREIRVETAGSLMGHRGFRREKQTECLGRGVYEVGPLVALSSDLFGFFPRDCRSGHATEVLVYPRLIPAELPHFPRRDLFGAAGAEGPVKDPLYILGTTDYHQGTPSRFIHWKASARHYRIQEKLFEPSQHGKVMIVVDVNGFGEAGTPESFEGLLEFVASLSVRLDLEGTSVGFLTNGILQGKGLSFVRVTRGRGHSAAILESLARLTTATGDAIGDLLERGLPLPWGVTCLYFASANHEEVGRAVAAFRRRHIPVELLTSGDLSHSLTPREKEQWPDLTLSGTTGWIQ